MKTYRDTLVDQFTRQADGFATSPEMNNDDALGLLVRFSGARPVDTLLDVACGPGLVIGAFAPVVKYAIGVDLVPAMLEKGQALQADRRLGNVNWHLGDVAELPFSDGSFSIVISRYAFHHLPEPRAVLAEMTRVCTQGGAVLVCDVVASSDPAQAGAYNQMEMLRDPSHVRALTLAELRALFAEAGLGAPRETLYRLEFELEHLLKGSFPNPGDAETVRRLFVDSLPNDGLGLGARLVDGRIVFSYPIAILCGRNPGSKASS